MRAHVTGDRTVHAGHSVTSVSKADVEDIPIGRPWLVMARAAWICLFATNLWYSAVAISRYHTQALHPCAGPSCVVTPAQAATLHDAGISLLASAATLT